MNLPNFLHAVNDLNEQLTHAELKKFVYVMAQKWPERKRESFLHQLRQIKGDAIVPAQASETLPVLETYKVMSDEIEEILAGKYHLESEYNEYYDEWHHDEDEDEFNFTDSDGVLLKIYKSVNMVHTLADHAMYEEAYSLADKLLSMKLEVTGDYADYGDEDFDLEALTTWKLLDIDYKKWFTEVLYIAYVVTSQQERPTIIYQLVERYGDSFGNYIANLAKAYSEIPQWEDFLQQWLDYLGRKSGRLTEKLIVEGIKLLPDKKVAFAIADKYAAVHPVYWNTLLEYKPHEFSNEEWYEFGRQTINKVDAKYVMRSSIALQTADYAMRIGRADLAEVCWIEAYRSHSTVVNYLRVLTEAEDFSRVQEQMEEIRLQADNGADESRYNYELPDELITNSGSHKKIMISSLLAGDYDAVREWQLPKAVVFLLMSIPAEQQMREGAHWALGYVKNILMFNENEYISGLWGRYDTNAGDVFGRVFRKWCERMPLPKDLQYKAIEIMEEEVPKQLEKVLTAKERGRYGECAALLALLGEAKEALGKETGCKEKIMQTYHEKYRRFSAFSKELRAHGWKG